MFLFTKKFRLGPSFQLRPYQAKPSRLNFFIYNKAPPCCLKKASNSAILKKVGSNTLPFIRQCVAAFNPFFKACKPQPTSHIVGLGFFQIEPRTARASNPNCHPQIIMPNCQVTLYVQNYCCIYDPSGSAMEVEVDCGSEMMTTIWMVLRVVQ